MNNQRLEKTMKAIMSPGKGILAADESIATITKRFQSNQIPDLEESRRSYRELLFTAPDIEKYIAGVILFEETFHQKAREGVLLPDLLAQRGILPGIKVDKGLIPLANTEDESVTQGLDGLEERLQTYLALGATFAKWRAVYKITKNTPSQLLIETNAYGLARYAAVCQNLGIVPIVEPEVLIDGDHTLETCSQVTERVLHAVFKALYDHKVQLEYIILKPSMILPGKASTQKADPMEVANETIKIFKRTVPAAVPTINFLSGGQTPMQATLHLNAMNSQPHPWHLSFSYARALQEPCLSAWKGKNENETTAQLAFIKRAQLNSFASLGKYREDLEK